MRYIIFMLLLSMACISNLFANEKFDTFNTHLLNGELDKAKEIVDNWGTNKQKDPQYYICQFNYYVNKGRSEGIVLQKEKPNGESLVLTDPDENEIKGYLGSSVNYNEKTVDQGILFIRNGIKLFPDHYEMRFGLLWIQKELGRLDAYIKDLESAMLFIKEKKPAVIYWNKNEKINDPNTFFLETVQGNFSSFASDKKLLENKKFFHSYADLMILHFPKHKYGYTNKGVLFYIEKQDDKALEYFLKALTLDKNDELILFNIAVFYQEKGNNKKAASYFKKVITVGKDENYIKMAKERLEQIK